MEPPPKPYPPPSAGWRLSRWALRWDRLEHRPRDHREGRFGLTGRRHPEVA